MVKSISNHVPAYKINLYSKFLITKLIWNENLSPSHDAVDSKHVLGLQQIMDEWIQKEINDLSFQTTRQASCLVERRGGLRSR